MKKVCFTGHRPQKLPWGFYEKDKRYKQTKISTLNEIKKLVKSGADYFMSGMALGFDMMWAEIVIDLKKKYKHIMLECVLPCKNQCSKWEASQQNRYKQILKSADKITLLSEDYVSGCMQKRNRFMIDNAEIVVCLFNGKEGGTKQTIKYAEETQKEIIFIPLSDFF